MNCSTRVAAATFSLLLTVAVAGGARAAMTLTAAGITKGFVLTTFADGFPSNGSVGPVGIGFPSSGGVIVSDYFNGKLAVFATDTDGQAYAGATLSTSTYTTPAGIARVGSHLYMALQTPGSVVEIDSSGNLVAGGPVATGIEFATGVTAHPVTGHLYVSEPGGNGEVYNVDPIAKTKVVFLTGKFFDGMTIKSDGSILYGASLSDGSVEGYDTTTGTKVFDSGFIPGGIDGSALGTGSISGFIYVVTNGGTIVEVNLTTLAQTTIATGGSRGDLVEIDPNNGTLLLTQTDRVLRLAVAGGGFGGAVPEPASLALWCLGLVGSTAFSLRRRVIQGCK